MDDTSSRIIRAYSLMCRGEEEEQGAGRRAGRQAGRGQDMHSPLSQEEVTRKHGPGVVMIHLLDRTFRKKN